MRKKKLKTSVVMACHNCEGVIGLCLKSVLANNPDEVIVINDASADNSVKIIKKYPVKLINLKKRSGVAKAEKIGVEKAKGDVIFITNSYIVVPPNWIERHLELHKKADCIGGWVRYDVKPSSSDIVTLPAYNCSFKRKVLEKIGFKIYGIHGLKFLRKEMAEIRFRPKFFWLVVSDITQKIVYHYPKLAFQLLAIKDVEK